MLPYLQGEKKAQAERLKSDLDKKSAEFYIAMDDACEAMSSTQCKGMRQELAAMVKSYDKKMNGTTSTLWAVSVNKVKSR